MDTTLNTQAKSWNDQYKQFQYELTESIENQSAKRCLAQI